MKKMIGVTVLALFLMGCGQAATRSEFWQHKTVYKNWDHMKFSWFGYTSPTAEDRQKAVEQGWWGIDVPYVPGQ
jgi:hypothetical protein